MEIILEGCLAFFAAVGVGAILLALIPTNGPEAVGEQDAPLFVLLPVQGDGLTLRTFWPQLKKHIHPANIILIDDGLDEQGQRIAAALLQRHPALRCCTRDALPGLIAPSVSNTAS